MSHDVKIAIINYVCDPLVISGALMLIVGPTLKIYRSLNKQAYPSQTNWAVPEKLCVIGFFAFAIGLIADRFILP